MIAALAVTETPLIAVVRRGTIARFFDDSILGEDLADFLETELRPPGLAAAASFASHGWTWQACATLERIEVCDNIAETQGTAAAP